MFTLWTQTSTWAGWSQEKKEYNNAETPRVRQAIEEVSAFNMTKVNIGIKSPTLHINYFEKGKKKTVAEQPADSNHLCHQYERIIINL